MECYGLRARTHPWSSHHGHTRGRRRVLDRHLGCTQPCRRSGSHRLRPALYPGRCGRDCGLQLDPVGRRMDREGWRQPAVFHQQAGRRLRIPGTGAGGERHKHRPLVHSRHRNARTGNDERLRNRTRGASRIPQPVAGGRLQCAAGRAGRPGGERDAELVGEHSHRILGWSHNRRNAAARHVAGTPR